MNPHPALSQALITEFNGERTRVVRRPSRHRSRLRAARSRRAARVAAVPAAAPDPPAGRDVIA